MNRVASSYYPPRARWYSPLLLLAAGLRRRLALDRIRLPTGVPFFRAVVQQYVYQKLLDEMRSRGFVVVEQETNEDRSIRLKVRHWEG